MLTITMSKRQAPGGRYMTLEDVWFLEKLSHFARGELFPSAACMLKGSGAYGTFTVTHDITPCTKADVFSVVGKQTRKCSYGFQPWQESRGAADARTGYSWLCHKVSMPSRARWDLVGNNTPVFYLRDAGENFPDLNHVVKRESPGCFDNMRSQYSSVGFLLPIQLGNSAHQSHRPSTARS